ncbi:4Fe-4S binding protein [Alistipes sp.]|uniref:4Fe-4S binding protein n=1 Tax=Alistipes sp. TaxID=1872444 RepID=UPI0025B98744|nr:4Fe-4S binding protein [Alistipes sp.]
MKPESVCTVVFSPTGTSKKIAEAVARSIASGAGTESAALKTIDLTHVAPKSAALSAGTVAVIAAPVYGGHVAPTAVKRLETLHGAGTPAVVIAVYGNRAFEKAAAELADLAARQEFVPVAAAAFVGEHSYSTHRTPIAAGRPDAQDLVRAAEFGTAVRQKLAAGTPTPVDAVRLKDVRTPFVPMLRFIRFVMGYRRRQKKNPVVYLPACNADRCTHCGRCAAICPTQAIARGDEEHTDPARCIRCCACVKGCPVEARSFHTPFAEALARNFARRKPPVTLL